jgi:hypothetical protein
MQNCRKYIRDFTLILLVIPCISTAQAAGLSGSATIQMTGSIGYSSFRIGIYESSWNLAEYNASTIAGSFDMSQSWYVYDPAHPEWDYSSKMNQVRALNPNYKVLLYRNCMSIYDYSPEEWNYANIQGWLLKDNSGNYVAESSWLDNYMVDMTNRSYQQWLGAKVKSWLDKYAFADGIMADNSLYYSAKEFEEKATSRPINPGTGTYFTDQEIQDACAGVLNAIFDAIGPSKLVVANGIWSGFVWNSSLGDGYRYILSKVPRLNGVMSEGCFNPHGNRWLSETDWLSSLTFASWIQDNFLNESGKHFVAGCPAYSPLPFGATTEQMMMYGFSSMLLCARYSSPQNTVFFDVDYWNSTQYPTELQLAQRLRNLDLAKPLGDYYKIGSISVYARDFVKGKVLVNPTDSTYTVALDRSYTTFDGSTVSGSLTVNAHCGVILGK